MRCDLFKKCLALLTALIMLFGCVSALAEGTAETEAANPAETEAAPAFLGSAFFGNLLDKLGTVDLNTRQLRLTVPSEVIYGGLTLSAQAQDGVGSLLLSSSGTPVAELQSDGRTLWLSTGSGAYSLSLADLREIAQNILGLLWLDDQGRENLGAFLSQNLLKLYQYTLADSVMVMQGVDGSTVIQLNLNGTRVMNGLASFLEELANSPDLSAAFGMREGSVELLAALFVRLTGQSFDSAFADTQIRDLLKNAAASLRRVYLDVNLFATVSLTLGRNAAVRVRATLVVGGQTYNLDADYTGSGGSGAASLEFYDARTRYVSARFDWKQQGGATQFELNADIGMFNLNVIGTASRDSLRAEVRGTTQGAWMPINGSITALRTKKTTIINVISNYGSLDVYLTASDASIALRSNGGATIDLVLRKDDDGLPLAHLNVAGIGYPGYLFMVDWDGRTLTVGSLEAMYTFTGREISAAQYALDMTFTRHFYGYYDYYSNNWYEPTDTTEKATLLFTFAEGGSGLLGLGNSDGWTLTASLQRSGMIQTIGTLEYTDQRSQQPLSGSPATQITWDFLLENLMNLLARSSYRSAPATAYPIEERVTEAVEAVEAVEVVEAVEEALPAVEYPAEEAWEAVTEEVQGYE